jgi:hypothetical protein
VRPSRDDVLAGNLHRLSRMIDAEMARADRYHHPFSLLVVKVPALADTVANDDATAAALAEEIHQGFRTRTRNSDFGCWIRRDSYALLSLEGTRRIKFLVSRLAAYLRKDLGVAGVSLDDDGVVVGIATYPGAARSADALLESAEQAARPYAGD